MEEEARSRRERLAALRAGAPIEHIQEPARDIIKELAYEEADDQTDSAQPKLSSSIFSGDATLEGQVAAMLKEAKYLPSLSDIDKKTREVTLDDLAPKRPNWDLKEDLQKRSAPLKKEYDRACIELIHERLAEDAEKGNS